MLGDDELEDGVAEKFEALIVELFSLSFMGDARMSERLGQETRVLEMIADPFFERVHGLDSLGRAARLFFVNFDRGDEIDSPLQDGVMQSRTLGTLTAPLGRLRRLDLRICPG